jgi:hypothetical protein
MNHREIEEAAAAMVARADEKQGELTYRSGGRQIENAGTVSLLLKFKSVEDMLAFRDGVPATSTADIREVDALDNSSLISPRRQFILRNAADDSVRVTRHITTEA